MYSLLFSSIIIILSQDFPHISSLRSELLQESGVVFVQKSHIINLIFQQCNTLQAHTKCETSVFFRVNAAHFKDMGVNHTAAQDLDPAGSFTETASFASALEAGNIHLCAWLCEREVVGTEFRLSLRSEQFFGKLLQSTL